MVPASNAVSALMYPGNLSPSRELVNTEGCGLGSRFPAVPNAWQRDIIHGATHRDIEPDGG